MPGGFGTLDEAFEVLTLIQCHKLKGFPIVAMGSEFWAQMRNFVRGALVSEKTISLEDLDLLHVTDSYEDAIQQIREGVARVASSPAGID
jgi:predicted Rossmann-fold nucleotide-binding protein